MAEGISLIAATALTAGSVFFRISFPCTECWSCAYLYNCPGSFLHATMIRLSAKDAAAYGAILCKIWSGLRAQYFKYTRFLLWLYPILLVKISALMRATSYGT